MERLTPGASAAETSVPWRRLRLRLGVFDAIRWRAKGLFRLIFPVPVVLKRFAALRHVLIFGMVNVSVTLLSPGKNVLPRAVSCRVAYPAGTAPHRVRAAGCPASGRCGAMGSERTRCPVASKMAFPTAGAIPMMGHSPAPADGSSLRSTGGKRPCETIPRPESEAPLPSPSGRFRSP